MFDFDSHSVVSQCWFPDVFVALQQLPETFYTPTLRETPATRRFYTWTPMLCWCSVDKKEASKLNQTLDLNWSKKEFMCTFMHLWHTHTHTCIPSHTLHPAPLFPRHLAVQLGCCIESLGGPYCSPVLMHLLSLFPYSANERREL